MTETRPTYNHIPADQERAHRALLRAALHAQAHAAAALAAGLPLEAA